MESPPSLIESLIDSIEAYIKTTIELSKFKALETVTAVTTSLISQLISFIVIVLFVIFLSIGVALYLGDMFEKMYYGFFIVAAFYLTTGVILSFSLHKWLKKPVSDLIISQTL